METADTPVNYKGNGTWQFEADLKSGHYEIQIMPHLFLYKLTLPSGEEFEGSIPSLMTKMENYHRDPELAEWLLNVMSWKQKTMNFKDARTSITFEVEDTIYTVDLNTQTGELHLLFPRQVIVVDKNDVGTHYPEVYSIKQGRLSDTLNSLVEEEEDMYDNPKNWSKLPLEFREFRVYEIDKWQFSVSFQPQGDLMLLDLHGRKEKTHVSTFSQDIWEVNTLHEGKYRDYLIRLLSRNGFSKL